jgi:hypothetical protein
MTGDKQPISGDSWRDSEAAKREKGGVGVQKIIKVFGNQRFRTIVPPPPPYLQKYNGRGDIWP